MPKEKQMAEKVSIKEVKERLLIEIKGYSFHVGGNMAKKEAVLLSKVYRNICEAEMFERIIIPTFYPQYPTYPQPWYTGSGGSDLKEG